ncbi:MAG: hypothetical protein JSV94_02995 [Methanobacteriota archaeon]|nr:MAG: hypothetical protein JSV94_02995 [Euryarchaeota archaeon]
MIESESTVPSEPAVEEMEPVQPTEPVPSPKKGDKKKLWIAIIAVIVAAALIGTTALLVFSGKDLEVSLEVESTSVPAGGNLPLAITVMYGNDDVTDDNDLKCFWSAEPDTLGEFDYEARTSVNFMAGAEEGEVTISCEVEYKGEIAEVTETIEVMPPFLDTVNIVPSYTEQLPDEEGDFTATALNSISEIVTDASFSWSVSGADAADYTLTPTTGATVTFSCSVEALITLTVVATANGEMATGTAEVNVTTDITTRSVDYLWYDIFGPPLGPWYEWRETIYGDEYAVHDSFPNIYIWEGSPTGNIWIYTLARMNMTARNLPELNMNENPEFLPYLSGPDGARGGTAVLDMYMNYLTYEEGEDKLGSAVLDYYDGWLVGYSGTITLDKQAAKAVIGITDSQFDNFGDWWPLNQPDVTSDWRQWFVDEDAPERLDIWPMYEWFLDIVYMTLDAEKVGDKIVVELDTVTWGMEAMVTRWMHEAWMPTEWYMEDMNLHATIGPMMASVDLDTAVSYALYTYETTEDGSPCWSWEALLQDYLPSNYEHPYSNFDPYEDFEYYNVAAGSEWYDMDMPWDYTPTAWNLSDNETITIQWPDEEIIFFTHDETSTGGLVDKTRDFKANATISYAEPMPSDIPEVVSIDVANRTIAYEGPFDMWTWSRDQVAHEVLADEWDRLGLIPYGIPFVEIRADTEEPPLEMIVKDVVSPLEIGQPSRFNVTVLNLQTGEPHTDYAGTVSFSSSDPAAVLPDPYEFDPSTDMGTHEFSVTFNTVDAETHQSTHYLTVIDDEDSTLSATQSDILVVESERINSFDVVFTDDRTIALEPTNATVTAMNQWDEVYTDYMGTVNFTSGDEGAELPLNTTYDSGWLGVQTFSITYSMPGLQNLSVRDVSATDAKGENAVTVLDAAEPDHYVVSGLEVYEATNTTITVNVSIEDQYDRLYMSYDGTLKVESNFSDEFVEPVDTPFAVGVPWVDVDVNFTAEGSFKLYFNDTVDDAINAIVDVIAVDDPPRPDGFDVSDITDMWEGNVSDVTVRVLNQYGEVYEDYDKEITFSSDAVSGDTLPGDYLFDPDVDHGVKTFPASVSFDEPGTYNVSVEEVGDPTMFGYQDDIVIEDLVADHLVLSDAPESVIENATFSVTVTAYHQHDEVFEEYDGTISFDTSDDSGYAVLPADFDMTGQDGAHVFTDEFSLSKVGTQTLIIDDGSLSDTIDIEVLPLVTTTLEYRIYDMFQEPWGPWNQIRIESTANSGWDSERPLTDTYTAGKVTYLYTAAPSAAPSGDEEDLDPGMIYAPYRWNVTGREIPYANVHEPYVMPVFGDTPVAGAQASVEIYFQYLFSEDELGVPGGDWTNYWIPEWGETEDWSDGTLWSNSADVDAWVASGESWLAIDTNDGYRMGTYYKVTMNREAAEEWMEMPNDATTPENWWSANGDTYIADWDDWILDQGNNVYDIYCGYEWFYGSAGAMMRLSTDGDDVVLEIGHFSYGYEALMTRWLKASGVSLHQPYMEDFFMVVDYSEDQCDYLTLDSVAQWSLHCNVQNGTSVGEDALSSWAWEPLGLDYITHGSKDSDYEPYELLTYQSWNCGDPALGTEVSYEATPWELDLPDYARIVIEMPYEVDVPGYHAEAVPYDALYNVWAFEDVSDYDAIRYDGPMSPGYRDINGAAYDYWESNNTLVIYGPADFDNPRAGGLLYHGAPWIEFNVNESAAKASSSGIPAAGLVPAEESATTVGSIELASASMIEGIVSIASVVCAAFVVLAMTAIKARRILERS